MTSNALKHEAKKQEWSIAIQDCRSSGLSVREWCHQQGTTTTTYYRWEWELLSAANSKAPQAEASVVRFAELPGAETGVTQHCGMFRHTAYRQRQFGHLPRL